MNHLSTGRRAFALALFAAVLLSALALAGPAAAAPSPSPGPTEPALTIDQLRADLGGGPLTGHFKTVLNGYSISTIPVQVLGLVDGFFEDGSPAILFEASGPDIAQIGGIADGMSGSPVYVNVAGDDYLVGAVSYGDWFTTNGMGLATPVESMTTMEGTYQRVSGSVAKLAAPVRVSGASVDSVAYATSRSAARHILATHPRTVVMHSLALFEIGGLSPQSQAYRDVAAKLEKRGVTVQPAGAGGGFSATLPSAPLEGGASLAAVLAYGDYWGAWVGTVTYTHDDTVVGFGHPADQDGDVAYAMGNAWVSGVWNSAIEPYKMVSLGPLQGTITEDRGMGIVGTTASLPALVTVNATATIQPSGRTVSTQTFIPVWATGNWDWDWLVPDSAYFAIYRAMDAWEFSGSADVTETIVVNDGTQDIPVARSDKYDDDWDVGYEAVDDVYSIMEYLLSNPNGVSPATLVSVDLTATLSPVHHWANIVDIQVPGGLKVGDNTVQTIIRRYGSSSTETLTSTLTIPAGTRARGTLFVEGGDWSYYWYNMYFGYTAAKDAATRTAALAASSGIPKPVVTPTPTTYPTPPSVADLAAKIGTWSHNTDLQVTFRPDGYDSSAEGATTAPTTTTSVPDTVMRGYVYKETPRIHLTGPRIAASGARIKLRGWLYAWDAAGTYVTLERQKLGSSAAPVTVVTKKVTSRNYYATFSFRVKVKRSTRYTVVWSGSADYLAGKARCKVLVMPVKLAK